MAQRLACIDATLIAHARDVMDTLVQRHVSVVTAESCTGGLLSAMLSHADGAGKTLHGAFVVYTKQNKARALGIDTALLQDRGAVNEEVVRQMVAGALARSPADLAIAVSGVLGPDPDEDGNPVGLIYIACGGRTGPANILCQQYERAPHDTLLHRAVLDALVLLERCAAG